MDIHRASRHILSAAVLAMGLSMATPALAARGLVIDVSGKSNALTASSCSDSIYTGCQYTSAAGGVRVSPNGFIELLNFAGGYVQFSAAQSVTRYKVLSGYTGSGASRVDFFSFYTLDADTSPNMFNNRPLPEFQIQLQQVTGRQSAYGPDLAIEFDYNVPLSGGTNRAPAGATIGYTGSLFGTQPGASVGYDAIPLVSGAVLPSMTVSNSGLLLGREANDSTFSYTVGLVPVANNLNQAVLALLSQNVSPIYSPDVTPVSETPEPATWAMLLTGFGVVGGAMRRRRRGVLATA